MMGRAAPLTREYHIDMDAAERRARLVARLVERGTIRSASVEAAFRAVPRHCFLPQVPLDEVYRDEAIPTKTREHRWLSSSSQPAMMAIMLEQLELAEGMRVLEIGAGSGYNAALLAYIVGPSGHVVTVDVDADTAASAKAHLASAGFDAVEVVCADGRQGFAPGASYDRIIATAAVPTLPSAWVDQLADGGIIVAPVGDISAQRCIAFVQESGGLTQRSSVGCGFMLMRDAAS